MLNPLADFVIQNVDSKEYYKKQFPNWNGDFNSNVSCPFTDGHSTGEDKKPSLSININGHGGAKCHACGTKIGSIIHFEKLRYECDNDQEAASRIYNDHLHPIICEPSQVEAMLSPYAAGLAGAPLVFKSILNDLKISKQTVERFLLGFDAKCRRVTIPIIDSFGQLLNIRHYSLPSMRGDDKYPKILNEKGYGKPAKMFPKSKLETICKGKHKPTIVYWFSGERDTLLGWDRGVPSFCYTTGESVCRNEWVEEIKALDCIIGIVQDNDKPGIEGAERRFNELDSAGVPCFIVELPGDEIKDFSDYIIAGATVKDFLALGHTEPKPTTTNEPEPSPDYLPIPRIVDPCKSPSSGEYQVVDIGRSPKLLNRPIHCRAIVSGKLDRTYAIPRFIEVGDTQYEIPISREMLQLVRETDTNILKLIAFWLNTKSTKIKILETIIVTECEITPTIQYGIDTQFINQRCYFFDNLIECNKPYLMTIVPTTDMNTQETVGLITHIEPVSNVLDNYSFSDDACKMLEDEFAIGDEDSYDMLKKLAELVATHHTHIYNRTDLHICALLSWICPMQFEFPCEGIRRGWLNTLILGDTETGKSEVCQKITKLFSCGVFISAESCSYVGLVGGAVKSANGGLNILRWGKIPLYNRQLVVIEELSGLSTFDISHMSEIRSAGIARYDKAGLSGETQAKTRLVCLSNVRGESKSLADYGTGVQASQALVGQNEDLARFDLILTVTDDEVEGGVINQDRSNSEPLTFSPVELRAFHELVMFAWSLKPEQIDFTIKAYQACLKYTLKMVGEYHSSLPVFKAGSGRLKLARIAVSIATIQFSWDNSRKVLVVTEKHVEAATKILHLLFRKPSFGYARYSKMQFNLQQVINPEGLIKRVKETFKEKEVDFYSYIAHSLAFTKFDMAEALGVHHMFVERCISQMFLSNIIKKGTQKSEWVLSRAGRKWVDKQLNEHQTV